MKRLETKTHQGHVTPNTNNILRNTWQKGTHLWDRLPDGYNCSRYSPDATKKGWWSIQDGEVFMWTIKTIHLKCCETRIKLRLWYWCAIEERLVDTNQISLHLIRRPTVQYFETLWILSTPLWISVFNFLCFALSRSRFQERLYPTQDTIQYRFNI